MGLKFYVSSYFALHFCKASRKSLKPFLSYRKGTREKNFMKISKMVFNLQSGPYYMVEIAMFNVQREISPKVGKLELRFISSASCLIEL